MMEMTITVNIPGLERLADAILALAGAKGPVSSGAATQGGAAPAAQQPAPYAMPAAPAQPAMPAIPPQQPVQQAAPAQPVMPAAVPPPQMPVAAPQQGTAAGPGAPAGAAGQAPTGMPGVPVTAMAPQYTQDQLAVAATGLVDAGKSAVLVGILQQFGAASLMDLPQDQYGAFAVKLREAGARI